MIVRLAFVSNEINSAARIWIIGTIGRSCQNEIQSPVMIQIQRSGHSTMMNADDLSACVLQGPEGAEFEAIIFPQRLLQSQQIKPALVRAND